MGDKYLSKDKKGQVTIFIILAIVIVVLGVLIYVFLPQIKSTVGLETKDPYTFIRSCLEDKLDETVENISLHGGTLEPTSYYLYEDEKLQYLCLTNEYFLPCYNQKPLLKKEIEEELNEVLAPIVDSCFDSLKEVYVDSGYNTILKKGNFVLEVLPEKILLNFEGYELTTTKGQNSETYASFFIYKNSKLYELIRIADNIVSWEINVGKADIFSYMVLYHDLDVEKHIQEDGTNIYVLQYLNSGEKFQFASRSWVTPL